MDDARLRGTAVTLAATGRVEARRQVPDRQREQRSAAQKSTLLLGRFG
jgi:hypothetical protein